LKNNKKFLTYICSQINYLN